MALYYNLSKIYAISNNDIGFAKQVIILFIEEVPREVKLIKAGIKEKDYLDAYHAAHKIKPTLDLLGMDQAYEDILAIEKWAKAEGKKKEIKETYKSLKKEIKQTLKELRKDYDL